MARLLEVTREFDSGTYYDAALIDLDKVSHITSSAENPNREIIIYFDCGDAFGCTSHTFEELKKLLDT